MKELFQIILFRQFFTKLPPVDQMYTSVPTSDVQSDSSSILASSRNLSSSSSDSTEDTLSIGSLVNLANLGTSEEEHPIGPPKDPQQNDTTEGPSMAMLRKEKSLGNVSRQSTDFQVSTPCCDFIIHHLFSQWYLQFFKFIGEFLILLVFIVMPSCS